MLHILFLILKIIGILLAVMFGIVLLAAICVLFVPVRYRIEAEGKLGGDKPLHVGVKVSWLLHIVSVVFAYPEAVCVRIKLFCFTVFDSSGRKKPEGKRRKVGREKSAEEETGEAGREAGAGKNDGIGEEAGIEDMAGAGKDAAAGTEFRIGKGAEAGKGLGTGKDAVAREEAGAGKDVTVGKEAGTGKDAVAGMDATAEEEPGAEKKLETAGSPEDRSGGESGRERDGELPAKGLLGKIKGFYLALKRLFHQIMLTLENMEYTIGKTCGKIKEIAKDIQYYTDVLKSDVFRGAWAVSKKQLFRVFKMLRPQVCRAELLAGTGDPAVAGQILAFYGMLYPFIGNYVSVEADFENRVAEGRLFIKGRVRGFVFLLAAFELFVNKNIRQLLKMLKKEDV